MSDKEAVLRAVEALPDGATWGDIADRLVALFARHDAVADLARVYRSRLTAADLAEYLDPKFEFSLAAVVDELKAASAAEAK